MERRAHREARLQLPSPYLLFYPPANARVHARIQNPAEPPHLPAANGKWTLDYGQKPTFLVQGVQQRQGNAIVIDAQGSPIPGPPAVRENEYAYPYIWSPFSPVEQGEAVPRGSEVADLQMVPVNVRPDDLRILRLRWRGTVAAAVAVGDGDGTIGPFDLNFSDHGGVGPPPPQPPPIVPGTVKITAPLVAGGNATIQDWPWPGGDQQAECRLGRLIGDVDPTVDSWIDYQTGMAYLVVSGTVVVAANNIVADFEHEAVLTPLDIFVEWDADMV